MRLEGHCENDVTFHSTHNRLADLNDMQERVTCQIKKKTKELVFK